jgi:hypothetical protein
MYLVRSHLKRARIGASLRWSPSRERDPLRKRYQKWKSASTAFCPSPESLSKEFEPTAQAIRE